MHNEKVTIGGVEMGHIGALQIAIAINPLNTEPYKHLIHMLPPSGALSIRRNDGSFKTVSYKDIVLIAHELDPEDPCIKLLKEALAK